MNSTFRRLAPASAALAVLLMASACGSSSSQTSSGNTSSPAPSAPAKSSAAPSSTSSQSSSSSSSSSSSGAMVKLSVGYPAASASFTPMYVAKEEGFFAKNGLDVSLHKLSGSSTEPAALASHSVQIVISSAETTLSAVSKGLNLVVFGSQFNEAPFQIWAKPSLTSPKQLEGKKLALEHVASGTDVVAHEYLPKIGINLSKVKLEYLGSPSNAIAALIAGKVDAASATPPPFLKAKAAGFKLLVDERKLVEVAQGMTALKSYVQSNPTTIEKFLKSYVEAANFIKNPANVTKIGQDASHYISIGTKSLWAGTLNYYGPMYQCDPTVSAADMANSVSWIKKKDNETADPTKVVDTAVLQKLEASGWVKSHCSASQ